MVRIDDGRGGGRPKAPDGNSGQRAALADYGSCLWVHRQYGLMFLAECSKQLGNWFTFLGAYAVILQLSPPDKAATAIAYFLMCRRLPALALFPVSGYAADRLPRGVLLLISCLVQGAVSFALPLVPARGRLGLLYPLIVLQYSTQAFYDPARTAAISDVVPPQLVCLAGTLDTFGFSLMALWGASLAGRTANVYGPSVCFRVEGALFVVAAALLVPLARLGCSGRPGLAASAAAARRGRTAPPHGDKDAPLLQPLVQPPASPAASAGRRAGPHLHPDDAPHGDEEEQEDLLHLHEGQEPQAPDEPSCGGLSGSLGALCYLARRRNLDVAVLLLVKATGALVWGAVDVINSRLVEMPSMQTLGGPDQTLGYIMAAVGLGCVVGPLLANAAVPGCARWWRVSIAASFAALCCGYGLLSAALGGLRGLAGVQPIHLVLLATVIRTSGSNTLWVHSTAILQHRLDTHIRGRVFAMDFVVYVVFESASTLGAGCLLDRLAWSTQGVALAIALLAGMLTVLWSLHAYLLWGWAPRAAGLQALDAAPPEGLDQPGTPVVVSVAGDAAQGT